MVSTIATPTIHKSVQQHVLRFSEELRDSRKSKRMSSSHCLSLECIWHTSQVPKGLQRRNGLDVEMPICASDVSKINGGLYAEGEVEYHHHTWRCQPPSISKKTVSITAWNIGAAIHNAVPSKHRYLKIIIKDYRRIGSLVS